MDSKEPTPTEEVGNASHSEEKEKETVIFFSFFLYNFFNE